jgi:hypothetical protein
MPIFTRENIHTHCVGGEWPDVLGTVALGESFVVEIMRLNAVSGPIGIASVQTGGNIAIHIETIKMLPPYLGPNGGPFFEGISDWVPLEYKDDQLIYPRHFRLRAKPSQGPRDARNGRSSTASSWVSFAIAPWKPCLTPADTMMLTYQRLLLWFSGLHPDFAAALRFLASPHCVLPPFVVS